MGNKEFDVQALIIGLHVSLLHHEDLQQEVEAVVAELKRQSEEAKR